MNQYPEALPPSSPYPNRLSFMQDFVVSAERPDADEQQRAAGDFSELVSQLFKVRGSRLNLYPQASAVHWELAVRAVGSTIGLNVPEQGLDLSAIDMHGNEADTYRYQLGRDGVVRRFDLPVEQGESQFESDIDFLQRVREVDDANAANEDFAIEMGMDGQPVSQDEIKALAAYIAENIES